MKIKDVKTKILITAAVLAYGAVMYFSPMSCPFVEFFGTECPGCGMTRAVFAALRLDISAAFRYHMMFWSLPLLYLCYLKDGELFPKKWMNILFYAVVAAGFLLNWLVF